MSEWKRASYVKEFSALPQAPKNKLKNKVERSVEVRPPFRGAAPPAAPRIWYLHYNQSQFGPYAEDDVHQYLRVGKIHGEVFAGAKAPVGPIGKIPILTSVMEAARARIKRRTSLSKACRAVRPHDKTNAPRRPAWPRFMRRAVFWQPESAATLVLADAGPDRPYSGCGGSA